MKIFIQIFLALLVSAQLKAQKTVDIYRTGAFVTRFTGWASFEDAVGAAISGDSLVLNASIFLVFHLTIDKDLFIQGTQTAHDSTIFERSSFRPKFTIIPRGSTPTKVTFDNIIFENALLSCSSSTSPFDSLYGAGIRAFKNTDVTISGNSVFRGCLIYTDCMPPYTPPTFDTAMNGGAAIYSEGKLTVTGRTRFYNNMAYGKAGGAICSMNELYINGDVVFDDNRGGAGGAIAVRGSAKIFGNTRIINSIGGTGGGIYADHANVVIGDSVQIVYNQTMGWYNGAVYMNESNLELQNKALIGSNTWTGVCMVKSSLAMRDSAVIGRNVSPANYGAGICNFGGSVDISGGQIVGNFFWGDADAIKEKGMAIYSDTFQGAVPHVRIANARIFNPTTTFERAGEVYNGYGCSFRSDSTWWGESDTTSLISNVGGAPFALNSWVIANWSVNNGVPTSGLSNFPVDAHFTLNSGAALPPKMFWMLVGLYTCDSGSFAPDTAYMASSNTVSSTFYAPYATQPVRMVATIDADTFVYMDKVTGLRISSPHVSDAFTIFPNPSNGNFSVKSSSNLSVNNTAIVVDLSGRIVYKQQLDLRTGSANILLSVKPGVYIFELHNEKGLQLRRPIQIATQ